MTIGAGTGTAGAGTVAGGGVGGGGGGGVANGIANGVGSGSSGAGLTTGGDPAPSASLDQVSGASGELRTEVCARIAEGKVNLPLLPQVASQVLMLAANAQADAAQLSALIHRDPALAGQVLRIANSAAYRPSMPIVSLQQAVARLGLNTVTEIALVASLQSGTFKVPGFERELKTLWRHAIASGLFAKEIARLLRSNVEAAFLCGLLHGVGKPALLQMVADRDRNLRHPEQTNQARTRVSVAASGPRSDRRIIAVLLEELHTAVGLLIAAAWGLPGPVVAAIGTYATYHDSTTVAPEAMITCLADRLATDLTEPGRFDGNSLRDHPVFRDLNLYPDDVAALLARRPHVGAVVDSMTT
ncbi:MAG: HDOD domain-containing protein [Myxococcales bacterium]